jgi:uncharacterized protein YozE (UPF0346 family)
VTREEAMSKFTVISNFTEEQADYLNSWDEYDIDFNQFLELVEFIKKILMHLNMS